MTIVDTLSGWSLRAVRVGYGVGAAVGDAVFTDGAPPVRQMDQDAFAALLVDASAGAPVSDEACAWLTARIDRHGYDPETHGFGSLLCCLPGPHAGHGADCAQRGGRRVRRYPSDIAGLTRLVDVARHATLSDEVGGVEGGVDPVITPPLVNCNQRGDMFAAGMTAEMIADIEQANDAGNGVKRMRLTPDGPATDMGLPIHGVDLLSMPDTSSVGGYRSRDPNAPPAPDAVGADLPEPGEDVPDLGESALGDAAADAAFDAAMAADMAPKWVRAADTSGATTPLGYLTLRNPTADPAALAEWLRVVEARDVVVALASAPAPAGMHETKSARRDAGRVVPGKGGGSVGISTGTLKFWTKRDDLQGHAERTVQNAAARWDALKHRDDLSGEFDRWQRFRKRWDAGEADVDDLGWWPGFGPSDRERNDVARLAAEFAQFRKDGVASIDPAPGVAPLAGTDDVKSLMDNWRAFEADYVKAEGRFDYSRVEDQGKAANVIREKLRTLKAAGAGDAYAAKGDHKYEPTAKRMVRDGAKEVASNVVDTAKAIGEGAKEGGIDPSKNKGPIAVVVAAIIAAVVLGLKVVR